LQPGRRSENKNMHKSLYYYTAAAATTGVAGILHFVYSANAINRGISPTVIFLIIAGIAQLFWVLPMIKRWGRRWYYVGIGGTLVLMALYMITRAPNPIIGGGRAIPISGLGLTIEVFQAAFIIITAVIVAKERTVPASQREELR
jgi:hypothetical protein